MGAEVNGINRFLLNRRYSDVYRTFKKDAVQAPVDTQIRTEVC